MRFPRRETVERIRQEYPVGCRVELLRMDDPQAPPIGTCGTVIGVDAFHYKVQTLVFEFRFTQIENKGSGILAKT